MRRHCLIHGEVVEGIDYFNFGKKVSCRMGSRILSNNRRGGTIP